MTEQDLKDKFKIFVNGYVGSSMLTNTEYPEAIELNANKCVQIAKDYAEGQNKELIIALKLAYENLNGSADEKVFQTIESLIFKSESNGK